MDEKVIQYLHFLRFCIGQTDILGDSASSIDWHELYEFAKKQSLVGIYYGGIRRLPHGVFSDIDLLAKWTVVAQKIRQKNRLLNERCCQLQQKLETDGFRTCILKGQGIATLYPDASLRSPGDIDIWLSPKVKTGKYPYRRTICEYIGQQTPNQKVRYHHIDFPIYKDVAVEAHFTPSYMYASWHNTRLQKWFKHNADLQYSNKVALADCEGEIIVPTISFNLVYILSHLYRHVFSEGIGLRQLLDYYYVLRNSDESMQKVAEHDITYLGMKRFATAVMWIMREVFGLESRYLLIEPNEKEGLFLLNEVLIGGNFGKYDTRLGDKAQESFLYKHLRMTIRNLRLVKHYPSEALCEPIFRATQAIKEKFRD